jgi:hypothetical protein
MRYGADDETEAARQRHAEREAREWAEDRRATERMWREGEARRTQAKWENTQRSAKDWVFEPIREADGRESGWTVFLNGHRVGIIIRVRDDLVVITSAGEGEADVHYVRGREDVSPDANQIMAAFQRQLPGSTR